MLPRVYDCHFERRLFLARSNYSGDLHKIGSSSTNTADMHTPSVSWKRGLQQKLDRIGTMDNQDQQKQLLPSQEIDLVDLVAVLYRRKVVLFIVTALCIVASIAYWLIIREKSEITMSFDTGRNGSELIMSPEESRMMLVSLLIPKHMIAFDLPGVTIENSESFEGGIVTITALTMSGQTLEKTQSAINSSFEDLLATHNKISERFLKAKETLLASNKQEQKATRAFAASSGLTAADLGAQHILEATIVSTQHLIDLSHHSEISKVITTSKSPRISIFLFAFVGLIAGIFSGCGFIFFLEIISQAKTRLAETG